MLIKILVACVLSGILYRLGGWKKGNTKFRDMGCPTVLLILAGLLFGFNWWSFLLSFGLSFGALTTYWDFIFKKDNFFAHGLACGLAGIPLIAIVPWWIILTRIIVCTLGMGLWSKFIGNDVIEETGRGVFFIL